MAVYSRVLESISGRRGITTSGEELVCTGNRRFQAGDSVWTDGKYIYGLQSRRGGNMLMNNSGSGILFLERSDDGIYLSVISMNDFSTRQLTKVSSNNSDLSCSIICENDKRYIMLNYIVYDIDTGKEIARLHEKMHDSVYRDMAIASNGDFYCVVETSDEQELYAIKNNDTINHIVFATDVDWKKIMGNGYKYDNDYFGVFRIPSILPNGKHYLYGGIGFGACNLIYDSEEDKFTKFYSRSKFNIDDYHNDDFDIVLRDNKIKIGSYTYNESGENFSREILSTKKIENNDSMYLAIDDFGFEIIKDGEMKLRNEKINFYNNHRINYVKNIKSAVSLINSIMGA